MISYLGREGYRIEGDEIRLETGQSRDRKEE